MSLVLHYHPMYTDGLSDEVRFPKLRYRMVREALAHHQARFDVRSSPMAQLPDIALAHDQEYIMAFIEGRLEEAKARRIGLRPWTQAIVERTLRITGGSVASTHALFEEGLAVSGNLAGGTHHAFFDEGAGYCIFNDIAVAARVAQRDHGVSRVLVVDLDVHQGDGTAAIFREDPSVFTFSMHCARNFPFRKQTSDLDIALEEGMADEAYLERLEPSLAEAVARSRPNFVIYQAGVDPLAEDHLGRLRLSRAGLAERNRRVMRQVRQLDVPMLVLMGGGYARPIERSVEALSDLFTEMADMAGPNSNRRKVLHGDFQTK